MPDYITEHHGGGWKYQFHIPTKLRPLLSNKAAFVRYIKRMPKREALEIARRWAVEDAAEIAYYREQFTKSDAKFFAKAGGLPKLLAVKFKDQPHGRWATMKPYVEAKRIAKNVKKLRQFSREKADAIAASWDRLFAEWIRAKSPRRTRDHAVTIRLLKEYLPDIDCRKVTAIQLEGFCRHLKTTDTTDGMIDTRLGQIKAMFAGARLPATGEDGKPNPFHGMANPAAGIKLLGKRQPPKQILPFCPWQVRLILDTAKSTRFGNKRHADTLLLLRLLAYTGARPNEIAQLQAGDVVEENGVKIIRIQETDAVTGKLHPRKSVKTQEARSVPLHNDVLEVFDNIQTMPKEAFIFNSFKWNLRDGRIHWLSCKFPELLKGKCKIVSNDATKKYVLYSLRHSFKDAMNRADIKTEHQKRLMGHYLDIHERYGSSDLPLLRDCINRLKISENSGPAVVPVRAEDGTLG